MPERIEDEAPPPGAPGESVRFRCPSCGAETTWDPDQDALVCGHCETRVSVPRAEGTIVERTFAEVGEAARGLGLARRASRCKKCGAATSYDEVATSAACPFCGSSQVLEQEANRNALRPESLVPLDVGRATVEREFRAWLRRLWFRPSALRDLRDVRATGLYVPFWTFDCDVHSEWSADAGHYYYVPEVYTTFVNGRPVVRTRMVQKIRWVPAWGKRDDRFDDLQVDASRGVPAELAAKLGAYDCKALVPYRPEYLAGWRAEEYAIDLEEGWKRAVARVESIQRERCSGDVPGDTQRDLRVANTIRDVRWKHVLLPMWSLAYTWKGKTFPVLIHGQTGRVVGEAPYSWAKIAALVVVVALAVLVVLLVAALSNG